MGKSIQRWLEAELRPRPRDPGPKGLYTSGLGQRRSRPAAPQSSYSSPTAPCPQANTRARNALPWKSLPPLPAGPQVAPSELALAPREREWDTGVEGRRMLYNHVTFVSCVVCTSLCRRLSVCSVACGCGSRSTRPRLRKRAPGPALLSGFAQPSPRLPQHCARARPRLGLLPRD